MPDNEARQIDPEGDIREIARHVAVAAGKIGTTVELREELVTLAKLTADLVAEVRPLTEALPTLARREELRGSRMFRQVAALSAVAFLILVAILFASNRLAVNKAHKETCSAINVQRGVLRDLIKNSAAGNDAPIDPALDPALQDLIRTSRENNRRFTEQALKDLTDNDC